MGETHILPPPDLYLESSSGCGAVCGIEGGGKGEDGRDTHKTLYVHRQAAHLRNSKFFHALVRRRRRRRSERSACKTTKKSHLRSRGARTQAGGKRAGHMRPVTKLASDGVSGPLSIPPPLKGHQPSRKHIPSFCVVLPLRKVGGLLVQGAAFPHTSNLVYCASGKKSHARMPK